MDMQQFSPSMLTYPEPPGEFDFNSLLQPNDDVHLRHHPQPHHYPQMSLHQHMPQPGPSPTMSDSGQATPPSSDNRSGSVELVRKQPPRARLERRGHTKSRRGCYNCKRRRIKCQETQPACGHCVKTGLKCEYPSMPQITHQPHHQIPLFSLQDMRFFQHFLTKCYPHHPLRQESVWTHEIPCIAHNHEYLMHAILGFAASELRSTDNTLVVAAMGHRIKAIKAIKKRLSEGSKASTNFEEANALIATCFALTFQSVALEDGLAEYMTFIRGIVIVGMQMAFRGIKPLFTTLLDDEKEKLLAPLMEGLPLIKRGWADSAFEALTNLKPLCVETVEVEYQEKLLNIVEKLYVDSYEAYQANSRLYAWWMMLPHHIFQELIKPDNQVVMLLHAHAIALTQIMAFIFQQEREASDHKPPPSSTNETMDPGFGRWLKFINSRIDYEHQIYNNWPQWVEEQLDRDLTFFGRRE